MKVTSINVNGIRAAARKGMFEWLAKERPDVVCLQEIKAQEEQLTDALFYPEGYHHHFHSAERKGYSGVAIYSRREPDEVIVGLGWPDVDAEGRYLEARFGNLSVISLYVQSGSSSEERQAVKFDFMARFMAHLREIKASGRDYIICGDWNIAHKEIDLKNWRGNRKNSGFLPEERAWMDRLFGEEGFHDAFRLVNQEEDQYTWWSNRGQAWAKNVGWRIDYHVITPGLKDRVLSADIYTAERFSDHAPLTLVYDYPAWAAE
ncbi:exodeoxyribonuclease III [Alkalilimnicola sp. S0819]|uniref:exodeoxyribonuclease III n=1 Tax=Alkalilimnicola sp. S0819 TaxID=2613922 RepID=UPI0012625AA3|nr:exodeoxyribonuclease III [Alkalilimnicola sp. S0819]KAB7623355.1 exodeoxyribonuclease III [Alkalilimnicola sp. S0819]MPQ16894.1 exodeoxyribonuclease III [Alkalilimnicola sp. S0819]